VTGAPVVSLKGRALRLLSQREHSRSELTKKLARYAESQASVDPILDELEKAGLLSQERFAQSLAYRRSSRFGARRIQQELAMHRVDDATAGAVLAPLRASEHDRAWQVWEKRFGVPPRDLQERARQQRFLVQRGFTGDAIAWVFRNAGSPAPEAGLPDDPEPFDPAG
jgi:regulatory protein